jgi:hypothetical protein
LQAHLAAEGRGGIALSADGWTGKNQRHYLGVTAHYITAEWVLKRTTVELIECGKKADDISSALRVHDYMFFILHPFLFCLLLQ